MPRRRNGGFSAEIERVPIEDREVKYGLWYINERDRGVAVVKVPGRVRDASTVGDAARLLLSKREARDFARRLGIDLEPLVYKVSVFVPPPESPGDVARPQVRFTYRRQRVMDDTISLWGDLGAELAVLNDFDLPIQVNVWLNRNEVLSRLGRE